MGGNGVSLHSLRLFRLSNKSKEETNKDKDEDDRGQDSSVIHLWFLRDKRDQREEKIDNRMRKLLYDDFLTPRTLLFVRSPVVFSRV